jgi:hypothetical protein
MSEQYWTQVQVSERTGKSRDAVRYQLKKAKNFPNATKNGQGEWIIPIGDVLAIGWTIVDDDVEKRDRKIAELEGENRDLRSQLDRTQTELVEAYKRLANTAPRSIESGLLGNIKRALLG